MMWLDMLRTPMAAPETPGLKAMRLSILWSALALALAVPAIRPQPALFGSGAGGMIAGLVLALVILVPLYVVRKNRADNTYFDARVRKSEGEEPLP